MPLWRRAANPAQLRKVAGPAPESSRHPRNTDTEYPACSWPSCRRIEASPLLCWCCWFKCACTGWCQWPQALDRPQRAPPLRNRLSKR